ncbi:uncharacterized protein SCHCODRAFT_01188222 [Schizophyllum commune H4-8]|uniref:Uncharacterized protein n=1 Tax=Schizophyllum commune (strain H4-8 / FGSC 9210) TaxID=578458 RepID=D8Q137_SCHCM|nr:uncharacterized protein SCHCODRAFT_01188222 [Schizophyllum commune H4-8]KAI5895256.1 hypothetical protein SCHCODRAFT_01188222 [Schizophyllum commune H4-8]
MEDNAVGSSRASVLSADIVQGNTSTSEEGTAQEETYITPRPPSSTPIHLKVDTKGKAKATDSDSSSSDSDSEDSPDRLSNASFESTPDWMRPIRGASVDPSSSVSPPHPNQMQDYRQRTGSPESCLSPGGDRRIGEKNKRAPGDTGEWLPGQPPPDTWPDSPTAKRMLIPSTSPRAPRGTFPVGSPPRREDFASATFSNFVPDDEPRFEWRGTQPTSPVTSARIRRPTSANFTPSVLSSAELESDDGSTDFDGEAQSAPTSSNMQDPEMDALVAEISKVLSFDNNGEALPQPIPVHTSDAYTDTGLESGFDGWHLSSSPGVATEVALMQVPMIDYEHDGPLDGETLDDYLSRTLNPDYVQPAYASQAAFQNFHFDPVGETTDPYSHLPHYAPPLENEENPFSVEEDDYLVPRGPVVRVEARVPSTATSDFSMPFQMSSARSAAQAADLIAEMQASGMLAQDTDAIAIDGELTPDDLLLLDNFGNLDLTSDEQMAWGAPGIDLSTGIDLSGGVDLSDAIDLGGDFDLGGPLTEADDPFLAETANDFLFDFPTADNAPFTPTMWPPADSFDEQPSGAGVLDAFDASFFGTNPQAFDWGNPDEVDHDPVHRAGDSVRRES